MGGSVSKADHRWDAPWDDEDVPQDKRMRHPDGLQFDLVCPTKGTSMMSFVPLTFLCSYS
jgi:hypothetical protein